jgi:hypothetical protein
MGFRRAAVWAEDTNWQAARGKKAMRWGLRCFCPPCASELAPVVLAAVIAGCASGVSGDPHWLADSAADTADIEGGDALLADASGPSDDSGGTGLDGGDASEGGRGSDASDDRGVAIDGFSGEASRDGGDAGDSSTSGGDTGGDSGDGGGGSDGSDGGTSLDAGNDSGDGGGLDAAPDSCTPISLPPSINVDPAQWAARFKTSPTWNCNAAGTTTIDSSVGTITSTSCTLGTLDITNNVAQVTSGAPTVMVVRLRGLTVTNSHLIRLQGDKPVVFLVSGNVLVDLGGRIDAGAVGTTSGPGGGIASQCGASTGQPGMTGANGNGGGGGGFGTAGGAGGRNTGSAGGVSAGTNLQPLRGGCAGGAADQAGGAGGGAFELSASGTIAIGTASNTAILSAAGGGSPGTSGASDLGSGGAGSGGGILLVAPTLPTFGSQGAARVHGGGSGGASDQTTSGEDGHSADNTPASGGSTSDGCGAAGASGGVCAGANCATSAAGANGLQGCGGGNSGGGGGGGRVQVITGTSAMSCQ